MSLSNKELKSKLAESELARTEQRAEIFKLSDELDKAYGYSEMMQEMNNTLRLRCMQLDILNGSLNKKILKGYLQ